VDLQTVLRTASTVAIVGCSDNPFRASNHAATMLSDAGYTVIPVNPKYRAVNGIPCLPDFRDIPDEVTIDIVNIFRNSSATLEAVKAVIERTARTGHRPLIWTQLGVSSDEARDEAIRAGVSYVVDRCIMTELARI
jgi:hypothetical protein